MIIPCPKCQARLNLPEDTAGSEVRCPGCRHVFRAVPEEEPPKRVLDPKPAPTKHPLDEEPYDRPPRRRHFDEDLDLREPHGDKAVLEDNAREQTRFAGQMMLAAGFGTLAGLLVNRGLAVFEDFELGLGPNNPEFMANLVIGTVFRAFFFCPLLIVMLCAGRNLLRLGPRGMINAGVAVSFVVASALALEVLVDLLRLAALGGSSPLIVPQMVVTFVSSGVSLTAGILAIRALSEQHVHQYYDLQRERLRRYRY
jgi:predicted Zn finger-like uncharacterized protein